MASCPVRTGGLSCSGTQRCRGKFPTERHHQADTRDIQALAGLLDELADALERPNIGEPEWARMLEAWTRTWRRNVTVM